MVLFNQIQSKSQDFLSTKTPSLTPSDLKQSPLKVHLLPILELFTSLQGLHGVCSLLFFYLKHLSFHLDFLSMMSLETSDKTIPTQGPLTACSGAFV